MKKTDHLLRNTVFVLILCPGVLFFISPAKSDEADKLPVVIQELVKLPISMGAKVAIQVTGNWNGDLWN